MRPAGVAAPARRECRAHGSGGGLLLALPASPPLHHIGRAALLITAIHATQLVLHCWAAMGPRLAWAWDIQEQNKTCRAGTGAAFTRASGSLQITTSPSNGGGCCASQRVTAHVCAASGPAMCSRTCGLPAAHAHQPVQLSWLRHSASSSTSAGVVALRAVTPLMHSAGSWPSAEAHSSGQPASELSSAVSQAVAFTAAKSTVSQPTMLQSRVEGTATHGED